MRPVSASDLHVLAVMTVAWAVGLTGSSRVRHATAAGLGALAYRLSRTKRAAMERALATAFGGALSAGAARTVVRGALRETWLEVLGCYPTRADRAAVQDAEVRGLERLDAALGAGRGAILWESEGLGRRFLAKQILHARGYAVVQTHGPEHIGGLLARGPRTRVREAVIQPFFDRRERPYLAGILHFPASGTDLSFARTLLDRLRQNGIVCVAGDGRWARKLARIDFLGHSVPFAPGSVSLARLAGAPLLPAFCSTGPGGRLRLSLEEPVPVDAGGDREADARGALRRFAALLEARIRAGPGAYRNWHRLAGDDEPA